MATARFGDEAGDSQFEDIPEEEWPDIDNPPQAAEVGEASKLAGKGGKGSKPVGNPPPRSKLKEELLHLLQMTPPQLAQQSHRIPPTNPRIPKQVLAQMTQVSRSM